MIVANLHIYLKERRRECEMTLRQAAEHSGLSLSYISDIERGRTTPALSALEQLARAYGKTISIQFEEMYEG